MTILRKKNKFVVTIAILFILQTLLSNSAYAKVSESNLQKTKILTGVLDVVYTDDFSLKTGKLLEEGPTKYWLNSKEGYIPLNLENAEYAENMRNLIGKQVQIVELLGKDKDNSKIDKSINVLKIDKFNSKFEIQNNISKDEDPYKMKKPWLNILCKFSDKPTEISTVPFIQGIFDNSFPFLEDYWRQTTFGAIDITGTQTIGWFTLPKTKDYYVTGQNVNLAELASDCKSLASPSFDFSVYAGTNLFFNDDLGGPARGGFFEGNRVTWLPPWSHSMVSVVAHEMGHTYGLMHSSGEYESEYDSPWDIMSNSYVNPGSISPYKFIPQHTIAFHKYQLGAIEPSYIWSNLNHKSKNGVIVNLNRLETKPTEENSYLMLDIYSSGGLHYTVEARDLIDYDEGIPANAVILHKIVDNYRAYVVDPDNNGNPGDEASQWTVGEVFENGDGDVKIEILKKTPTGFDVKVTAPFAIPIPIYRLYNTRTGAQLYTRGEADRDKILAKWNDFEFTDNMPAFYASLANDGNTPIYRLYNTKTGAQLYTRGEADRDKILAKWHDFEFTDNMPAFYANLLP